MNDTEIMAQTVADLVLPSLYNDNELESKEQFNARLQSELVDSLSKFQKTYQETQTDFINNDPSGAAKRIFDKLNDFIEKQIDFRDKLTIEDYNTLFDLAMQMHDTGNLQSASCMLSTIVVLFPQYIQPYIILANILWDQEGIEPAIAIYQQLIQTTVDPLLYACAANCFVNSSEPVTKEKGKSLFQEALDMISSNEEKYANYKYLVEDIQSQLSAL